MNRADARQFLLLDLPHALAPLRAAAPLTVQFLVPGVAECRAHYVISEQNVATAAGLGHRPDVTVSLQLPELEALSQGRLNVQEAMTLNHVQLFGDQAKASLIAEQLAGAGSLWGAP